MAVNNNKQKLLLEYLISSVNTFALCKSVIRSEYFDPDLRKTVDFLTSYYDKYNATPTPDQIEAETGVKLKKQEVVTKDQVKYTSVEVESFCRRAAFEKAIYAAPELIAQGKYGEVQQNVRDALLISLTKDLGLNYFKDPLTRLESKQIERTSTKWDELDSLLGGGLARTEMILFTANSGGGKSITLANLGVNFLAQKLNVLYISLELSTELIAQRFDTMFTGVPSIQIQTQFKEVAGALVGIGPHMGELHITHMPSGTNANQIRAFLKEFELTNGFVPDLLIVDYLDLMGANEKVSADNIWEKDKRAAEQLRDIGFDYNMFIATASQQNRAALEATELHQGHIAGGISKVNTVDWHISIILSPSMKAAGEIGFCAVKTRSSDGAGKTVYLTWDNNSLRIRNARKDGDSVDEDGVIINKIAQSKSKKKFEDLFNS